MLTFLNQRQSNQSQSVWERLLRHALVLVLTAVLFGSLYIGIKFLE